MAIGRVNGKLLTTDSMGGSLGPLASSHPFVHARRAPGRENERPGERRGDRVSGTGVDRLAQLRPRIEAALAEHAIPGLCLGVLADGEERYLGFGTRSVERPGPVTADTRFRVASISKVFTSTVLMRLTEDGHVDLDVPLSEHVPGFGARDPAVRDQLSLRDLLTHREGLAPNVTEDRPPDELDDGALDRAVADIADA